MKEIKKTEINKHKRVKKYVLLYYSHNKGVPGVKY